MSLHADMLPKAQAAGATIYTWDAQSNDRAAVEFVEHEPNGHTKYSPLAEWTWGDVWHYIAQNAVDYNPLHDQFYPSIGCEPCTRAINCPKRAWR